MTDFLQTCLGISSVLISLSFATLVLAVIVMVIFDNV